MTAKERKRTLSGVLHDALYTCHNTCLSKWPPNIHEQPCLLVRRFTGFHPEIALTLEKCLIQGKIIVCLP